MTSPERKRNEAYKLNYRLKTELSGLTNERHLKVHYLLIAPTAVFLANEISVEVFFLVVVRQEFDVCEREEADFPSQLALPLPVYVHLCYFNYVAHLQLEGRLIVGVWHPSLLDAGVSRQFSLKRVKKLVNRLSPGENFLRD